MNLERKLKDKSARVGVMGLGYVGLPLAVEFARAGFSVEGVEIDAGRAAALRRGKSYVEDVASDEVARLVRLGRLKVRRDGAALGRCDAVLICVQTPLRKTKEPDLGPLHAACRTLSRSLRPGQLIILESTTYPGTTDEVLKPALEEAGLKAGKDFFLAFSPERVDPGNKRWKIPNTPKVVGGINPTSTRLAAKLYATVIARVVPVTSAKTAELVKLLENSFRAVNIALVNEMARICHRLGLDVWEVISAAATKPFGFMPFWPGPGIGGHCIPKDPQLLSWRMKTLNFEARVLELAARINADMPSYTVARIAEALNHDAKPMRGSRILILGVAYKPGVSDYRESPALDVMHLLAEAGARVDYHDAWVARAKAGSRSWTSRPLSDALVARADLVVILTAQPLDYARVLRKARRVFDARNAVGSFQGIAQKLERL